MNYKDLNDRQSEALYATEGPVLILAGAGSGKTKVVTEKIAYLIDQKDVYPSSILAITFTNKAAKEMLSRVENLTDNAAAMWIGTFHAICLRILRVNIERLGYQKNFTIYDTGDQNTLVSDCIKELNLSKDLYKSRGILAVISALKNDSVTSDEYINANYGDFFKRNVGEIYALYQKKLKANNALDFDDLILETVKLLKDNEDVCRFYRMKFKYIFVDEYQDTNAAQYALVKLLAGEHPNLTVVGDNDQSIYAWRGADIRNILNFEKDYSDAKVILLEQNYRSTRPILSIANEVIAHNKDRKDKNLWTDKEGGKAVSYRIFSHNNDEEAGVIQKIIHLNYKGKSYEDMAILYRTNAQSRGFEEALIRERIPYRIVGGLKFYDRKEVKDVLAYLKFLQNTDDNVALNRVINVPKRGIGVGTMEQLAAYADDHGMSIYEVIRGLADNDDLHLRSEKKLIDFKKLIEMLRPHIEDMMLSDFIEKVLYETGYVEELKRENTVEARTRIENVQELISTAIDSERRDPDITLEDFLSGVSLLSDVDKSSEQKGVNLMTVHAAKGLEFPVVFVVGLEERLFPSGRAIDEDEDVEEERRLCYVALTRAEEELYLSSATTRTMYGRTAPAIASRFIKEMGEDLEVIDDTLNHMENDYTKRRHLVEVQDFTEYKKTIAAKPVPTDSTVTDVNVGDKIIHKKWKEGMVVSKVAKGTDTEIVVSFDGKGLKRLMLSIAPIKVVKK
ncbi:UvrD-helicase domain-containing protein [Peptoniphilus equinus]|uniref:DNA 3'-5' helicase n=1 Tax=Peptoniphilus equinus TaxID=3016343 RepID=A0ABY7QV09_9FIRM|nr:UvrD-helicase domain-containing protein [Peptoniphilus equinus]WBW50612.1 UvrD-helicase domain-containing protein [Peptoniphilus equinus]